MLGFVGGPPNRPGRGHCAEEWKRFPLPAKFPPYSQSALPDRCNSLSPPAPFEKRFKHGETRILFPSYSWRSVKFYTFLFYAYRNCYESRILEMLAIRQLVSFLDFIRRGMIRSMRMKIL